MGKNTNRPKWEIRTLLWTARHPGVVVAPGGALASVMELGAPATGTIAASVAVGALGWARSHPVSFSRHAAPVLRGFTRRWTRYLGPRWTSTMAACGLARESRATGRLEVPRILKVSAPTPTIDWVMVRLVRGQSMRSFTDRAAELAAALDADSLGITKVHPNQVWLSVVRGNPFTSTVPAAMIPDDTSEVDFGALEFGEDEYGQEWTEPAACHFLGAGATGSGKSGLMWNPLRSLAPAIRDGLVRVWMADPKGGMETRRARPMFYRYADHVANDDMDVIYEDEDDNPATGPDAGAEVFEMVTEFRDAMKATQTRLAAEGVRKASISMDTPLNILVIDELAMVTALGGSARLLNKLLGEIMTQGRAANFFVWAYVQEPTKDIVPIRELFTRRVTLRTTTASYVDMVCGDGARDRGALADEIPADDAHAGIGFRTDDRTGSIRRVRAGYITDEDIDELVREATPRPSNPGGQVVPIRPAA